MALFEVVSSDGVLSVGPFGSMTALAREQGQRGVQVTVRRAAAPPTAPATRGWAVRICVAGTTDVLHCLDQEDALATLHAVQALGLRATIVQP